MKYLTPRLARPVAFLAVMVVLAGAVFAGSATLEVRCVDQAGSPANGITVQITPLETGKSKDKKTDAKGIARFDKLDDGTYRVIGRKDGLAPALYEFAVLKGTASETVTLKLEPGDSAKKFYYEDQALDQKSMDALRQAVDAMNAQKFAEAEKLLKESLAINFSNPQTHMNLAIASVQQNKWDMASEELRTASKLAGAFAELTTAHKGDPAPYQQMKKNADDILAKLPSLKLRGEAGDELQKKNFPAAIAKYQEALKAFPDDPDTYYNLALAQAHASQYEDAVQSLDKALQLRPNERAFLDLKKQIGDRKTNEVLVKAQELLDSGNKMLQAGNAAGALEQFQKAQPMIPEAKQSIALAFIARAQAALNKPDEAIKAFNKAIELAPQEPAYRKELSQYLIKEKKYEEALQLFTDPRALGSEAPEKALFTLGQRMSKEGNSELAVLAFEKALQANPQSAETYYELGMLSFYDKKDAKRATELLNKYLEMGKDKDHLENTKSVLVVIQKQQQKK